VRIKQVISGLRSRAYSVDWTLLAFLILFLNIKLVVKVAALVLVFILRPNFKFGFALRNSRLPLFYLLVIGIAIFNWLISGMMGSFNYGLVLATGIFFWILCILAVHQIKLSVEKDDPVTIHQTVVLFFILNALVSLFVYVDIVAETGAINVYRYQGNYQRYFIGTGDYIKGISFDTSTTNAILNAFGVIYFLQKGKNIMTVLCMAVLLLTSSNITNLMLCGILVFLFFLQSNRIQKSMIIICIVMFATFLIKISPQNNNYIVNGYREIFNIQPGTKKATVVSVPITKRPDSSLTEDEKKQKIAQLYLDSIATVSLEEKKKKSIVQPAFKEKPEIPGDNIHTAMFQYRRDTNDAERILLQFMKTHNTEMPISAGMGVQPGLPGKVIAFRQTFQYFSQHTGRLLLGTGIGNFSSKLAFRATSMKMTGGYPEKFIYINDDFKSNHLDLYLYYFTSKDDYHSIANSPNSTYDQLLSEYGVTGFAAFAFFYIGFFIKKLNFFAYSIPLLLFMSGIFFFDYWFEQLSVIVFFELLLLLNIKEIDLNYAHSGA
jgi:hypothetical protein